MPPRLGPDVPAPLFGAPDRGRGLLVGVVIGLLATITRFWALTHPTDKGTPVFDEKHYAPQAWQMLHNHGVEDNPGYGLVVHPPVGKQMIALGEALFGYDGVGWRFTGALCGVILVLLVVRITRRISRSTVVGGIAGLLLIADGVSFVIARTALLTAGWPESVPGVTVDRQCGSSQQALHFVDEIAQMERLRQDLCLPGGLVVRVEGDRREAGDEHDLDVGIEFGGAARQFDPVHFRHHDIGEQKLERLLAKTVVGGQAVVEGGHVETGVLQRLDEKATHVVVVFGQKDARHAEVSPVKLTGP